VSLKLPTFWTSQPEVWFTQAEAQFHIHNITADATKYYYVVSALDQPTAGRVLDVLQSPPIEDKYDHLKQHLLRTSVRPKMMSDIGHRHIGGNL